MINPYKRKIRQLEIVDCPMHEELINLRFCLGCVWHEGYYDATKYVDCTYNEDDN